MRRLISWMMLLLTCSAWGQNASLQVMAAEGEAQATCLYLGTDADGPKGLTLLGYEVVLLPSNWNQPGDYQPLHDWLAQQKPRQLLLVSQGEACQKAWWMAHYPQSWGLQKSPLLGWIALEPGPLELRAGGLNSLVLPSARQALDEKDSLDQKALRRFVAAQAPLAPLGKAGVPFVLSPNWTVRGRANTVDTIVLHATVINTMAGTQRAFLDDRVRRVSAHYIIDRDGSTVQMVDERRVGWHAGVSELEGRTGVNEFSLGIELINLNDGRDPYPEAQMQALVELVRDIRTRWNVPDSRIVSHAQIARPIGRKSDPLGFDFDEFFRRLKRP